MSNTQNKYGLFSYLDKVMGEDGIKTNNKIQLSIDSQTAITLIALGAGLIIFSHAIGIGRDLLIKKKTG